jgi:prepilin-type N-terminal cleavage/methylation domain-containing protein
MFFNTVKKLGFTMIELLIVIAVLGVLAVAVLSAINPIEQINRGKDTGSRSDAEQLLSSIDRYYATKGYYPWMISTTSINQVTSGGSGATPTLVPIDVATEQIGTDVTQVLQNLSSGGSAEIKESFVTRIVNPAYNFLSIYNDGVSSSSTYVCFTPKSSAFREEAWDRCTDVAGGVYSAATMPSDFPAAACLAGGTCTTAQTADSATGCMICLP